MGWYVISFAIIECQQKLRQADIIKIKGFLKYSDYSDFQVHEETCSFTLGGNKGVDYTGIENIKKYLKEKNYNFTITANEFSECGDGYYYDSQDE